MKKDYFNVHENIYIGDTPDKGQTYFAKRDIAKGEIVYIAHGAIVFEPTDYTVPIGLGAFINPTDYGGKYTNDYGINANLGIKNRTEFVAMRDIKEGEEVGPAYFMFVPFFIPDSTADSLDLSCFSHLDASTQEQFKEYISDYLFNEDEVGLYKKFIVM